MYICKYVYKYLTCTEREGEKTSKHPRVCTTARLPDACLSASVIHRVLGPGGGKERKKEGGGGNLRSETNSRAGPTVL